MTTHYDFDAPLSREGSGDLMHAALKPRWGRSDLLPLWVADLNFPVCPDIINALRERLNHPVLGYTVLPRDYFPAIHDWLKVRHGWEIRREWLTFVPGVVKGIGFVVNSLLEKDDRVVVMPPVYHPFFLTPCANGREVVWAPLREVECGQYEMDFEALAQVCDDRCKLLILCNPHNPVGICWSADTLRRLASFCAERHMVVISDEIHADLPLFGHRHTPFATVSDEAANISITLQAPSKTFNVAGVVSSHAIVPNETIRQKLFSWMQANELDEPHLFAPIATVAAYRHGEEWLRQMLAYVEGNIEMVENFCRENIPGIRVVRPQASFLVWLDCRDLHLTHEALLDLFIDGAHLALNDGEMFGPGGEGHMRLNVGTQRAVLRQAMEQLAQAVRERVPC